MVLIIGVIGFTFGIGVVIYTHLIKNRDALSSVFDILEDVREGNQANRSNFDTLRSASHRANRMEELYLNSHQTVSYTHLTLPTILLV